MSRIVSVHSFRGGTGKSNITSNLSYLLALAGKRIAVVDTDIQSPGIHVLFGVTAPETCTLNDFLWGKAEIDKVALDISGSLGLPAGRLFFIPSSMKMGEITRILKEGYDVGRLTNGFRELVRKLALDYLIIDTHPGLNEETLLSIAISDILLVVMRPDQQDFQGTSVTVEVARRLKCQNILLVVNKVLAAHHPEQVRAKVESTYGCPAAAVLPLSEKIVELASSGLFVRTAPGEAWSAGLRQVAERVLGQG